MMSWMIARIAEDSPPGVSMRTTMAATPISRAFSIARLK